MLIEGTVGDNLDPFGVSAVSELEAALVKVGLSPALVGQQVGAAGEQLSVGERQLVAIARILLRQTKIVVMDEPTAHIDPDTDAKLQVVHGCDCGQ